MCEDPPADCLSNYDDLDLSDRRQRRLATYCLEDYYGTVLSEYGREYLNFTHGDISDGIGVQWNKAKSRMDELEGVQIPDEYNDIIHRLNTERNTEVSHDYTANPSLDRLDDAREIAEDWADWFINQCESYAAMQEEQTAEEMIEDMVNNITNNVFSTDIEYFDPKLQDKQKSLESKAKAIQEDLVANIEVEGLSSNDGVDKELIQILLDAVELRNDKQSVDSKHRYEKEKMERREAIRRSENTYRCMVVEGYEEESRTVHVVNHEYNHPDTSYVINVPDFPEQEGYLKDLENGDTVQIEVDHNIQGSEYIREIV